MRERLSKNIALLHKSEIEAPHITAGKITKTIEGRCSVLKQQLFKAGKVADAFSVTVKSILFQNKLLFDAESEKGISAVDFALLRAFKEDCPVQRQKF